MDSPISLLYIFDDAGVIVDSITDTAFTMYPMAGFEAKDDLIYVKGATNGATVDDNFVAIYTYAGELVRRWHYSHWAHDITKGNNDTIYLVYEGSGLDVGVLAFGRH